jgi:mono/diheme cytochrome c family protein
MYSRALGLLLLLYPAFSTAADLEAGRQLHDANCTACHQSLMAGEANRIYTRPDRRVDSYDELVAQVRRCELNLGLQWLEEDVSNVAAFLNTQHYHF